MNIPGKLDITADRFTPLVLPLVIAGLDLNGAVFKAQVRDRPNGGALRAEITVALISTVELAGTSFSHILISADQATVESLPASPDPGTDLPLVWDMHITPPGDTKQVYFKGAFTVRGGITE